MHHIAESAMYPSMHMAPFVLHQYGMLTAQTLLHMCWDFVIPQHTCTRSSMHACLLPYLQNFDISDCGASICSYAGRAVRQAMNFASQSCLLHQPRAHMLGQPQSTWLHKCGRHVCYASALVMQPVKSTALADIAAGSFSMMPYRHHPHCIQSGL